MGYGSGKGLTESAKRKHFVCIKRPYLWTSVKTLKPYYGRRGKYLKISLWYVRSLHYCIDVLQFSIAVLFSNIFAKLFFFLRNLSTYVSAYNKKLFPLQNKYVHFYKFNLNLSQCFLMKKDESKFKVLTKSFLEKDVRLRVEIKKTIE